MGALNENRFGWGAASVDFNNDGHVDIAQANGMVDNVYDNEKFRVKDECPDYWYINEKLARSPPEIHRYIDNWGDIRGKCIHGYEKNRLYINRGPKKKPQFVDVADQVGMNQVGNWRGMAAADFNNDGQLDLIASSLFRNPLFFKNKGAFHHQWIGIDIESLERGCNREAFGSTVKVNYSNQEGTHSLIKEKVAVNGFSAQSDSRLHFGLGKDAKINSIEVNWCGRKRLSYNTLATGRYHKILLN